MDFFHCLPPIQESHHKMERLVRLAAKQQQQQEYTKAKAREIAQETKEGLKKGI